MATGIRWVIPRAQATAGDESQIGGKAAKLAQLARAGFCVPDGFFITTRAYEHFVEEQGLSRLIRIELGRKPFASMRWEEIWDVALRIRSAFLAAPIPKPLAQAIVDAVSRRCRGLAATWWMAWSIPTAGSWTGARARWSTGGPASARDRNQGRSWMMGI